MFYKTNLLLWNIIKRICISTFLESVGFFHLLLFNETENRHIHELASPQISKNPTINNNWNLNNSTVSKICFEQKGYSFDLIQYATLNNAIKSIYLGVIVPLPVLNWFSTHNFDNRDVPFFLQSKPCLLILAVRNNDSVGIGWPAPSDQLYWSQLPVSARDLIRLLAKHWHAHPSLYLHNQMLTQHAQSS